MEKTNDKQDRSRPLVLAEGAPGYDEMAAQFSDAEPVVLETIDDVRDLVTRMRDEIRSRPQYHAVKARQTIARARRRPACTRRTGTRSRGHRARPARRTTRSSPGSRSTSDEPGPGEPPGRRDPLLEVVPVLAGFLGRRGPARPFSCAREQAPPSRGRFQGEPAAAPGVVA